LEPDLPVIAAAGRLSKSKGFDVLIRALGFIDDMKVACVIAGSDGGELSNLRQLSALVPRGVKVVLPGWLDRERLSDLLRLASVVAVPSRDEPFGLVALEAIGAKRRVVASRVGGLGEFLRPPIAELVDSDDPHAWAMAITRALSRGLLTDQDERAVDRILADHTWPHLAHEYEVLMMSCLRQITKTPQ
jgi:D-inositol-3-phosphate glycosyltransferase